MFIVHYHMLLIFILEDGNKTVNRTAVVWVLYIETWILDMMVLIHGNFEGSEAMSVEPLCMWLVYL